MSEPEGFDDLAPTVAGTAEHLLAFENAALPLSVIDVSGRIVLANRAMRELLAYDYDELIGKAAAEVVAAADHEVLFETWDDRIQSGMAVTPERPFRLWRKDGAEVAVRSSSALVCDEEGTVRYVVARVALDSGR